MHSKAIHRGYLCLGNWTAMDIAEVAFTRPALDEAVTRAHGVAANALSTPSINDVGKRKKNDVRHPSSSIKYCMCRFKGNTTHCRCMVEG